LHQCLIQRFPTFFQPWHTYLELLPRRHTAFMALILYTRLTYDIDVFIYTYVCVYNVYIYTYSF